MSAFAFRPVWRTAAGVVTTAPEGSVVATPLQAEVAATIYGSSGQDTFAAGALAPQVSTVKVNGNSVAFSISGQNVVLATPLSSAAAVEAILGVLPTRTFLNGTIPPGLELLSNGMLQGTLAFVAGATQQTFSFTVRATFNGFVRDRQFSVVVTPVTTVTVSWNYALIPPLTVYAPTGTSSSRIATLSRGAALTFQPEIIGTGDVPTDFALGPIAGVVTAEDVFNAALPSGLTFNPDTGIITGVVSPSASPGIYFFEIAMVGDGAPTPLPLSIEVTTAISQTVDAPDAIEWVTPAGSLGSISEGQQSVFAVSAKSAIGASISYSMLSGSQMPPGLLLDNTTGEIRGRVTSVGANATYSFTVRATSGTTFEDRTFSISALNRYNTASVLDFRIRVSTTVQQEIWASYASKIFTDKLSSVTPLESGSGYTVNDLLTVVGGTGSPALIRVVSVTSTGAVTGVALENVGSYSSRPSLISSVTGGTGSAATFQLTFAETALFRPSDPAYGLVDDPNIYIIGGIDGTAPIVLDQYHRKLSLVLGGHRIAYARQNGTGAVLYEVLYREVYDPLDRTYTRDGQPLVVSAGGFSRTSATAVEQPVPYPQGPGYVYPNSLRNIRLDIIDDFGFASADAALRKRIGSGSVENLPLWMTSRQVANDPSSVLGFVPSVVVAFLRPGQGTAILSALTASNVNWREGYELDIDRYLITGQTIGTTTFDGDTTTFDTGPLGSTRFDATATEQGKYQTLNDVTGVP